MVDLSCETNSTQTIPMQSKEKEVFNAIKCHFTCDIRRVKFISCLIVSLLKLNDCSLSEWSKGVCLDILLSSKYKRLQRLLCGFRFGQRAYFKLVWSAYGQADQVVLTLDRTDYIQRGQTVQILMLGIAHKGVSIPLLWHTANREGNSSKQTRLALLKALERWAVVKPGQKVYLTGDREFIGKEMWTGWFTPVIRVRANAAVVNGGKSCRADKVFGERRLKVLRKPRVVYGQRAYLTGMKLEGEDFLILMSRERVRGMAGIYAQRWQVETLFGAFKSRGFNLEKCRVNDHRRIRTLLFLLAIALVWAIRAGEWLVANGRKIPIKKLRTGSQPLNSLFRHGLNHLQNIALNHAHFQKLDKLLYCT